MAGDQSTFMLAAAGALGVGLMLGYLSGALLEPTKPSATVSSKVVPVRAVTTEDREFLRMMYEEHAEHARAHEDLRGAATGFLVALIAGLLAYAAAEKGALQIGVSGLLTCATSIIGILIILKHYERFKFHCAELSLFRRSLEEEVFPTIRKLHGLAEHSHNLRFRVASRIRIHFLWLSVFILLLAIGLLLICSALAIHYRLIELPKA